MPTNRSKRAEAGDISNSRIVPLRVMISIEEKIDLEEMSKKEGITLSDYIVIAAYNRGRRRAKRMPRKRPNREYGKANKKNVE